MQSRESAFTLNTKRHFTYFSTRTAGSKELVCAVVSGLIVVSYQKIFFIDYLGYHKHVQTTIATKQSRYLFHFASKFSFFYFILFSWKTFNKKKNKKYIL